MFNVCGKHLIIQWQQHKHRAWYYTQPLLYVLILALFMGMASLYGDAVAPRWSSNFMVPLYALVALISYQRHSEVLFFDDFEDGTLKQYIIHNQLMPYSVAHTLVWWGLSTLPLVLCLVLCVMILRINQYALLFATVMLASVSTAWICAFANAVSLSHQRPDFLRALITLPLLVSIYVLAIGVGFAPAVFWLLLSLTVFLSTFMPFAVCWALKVSLCE